MSKTIMITSMFVHLLFLFIQVLQNETTVDTENRFSRYNFTLKKEDSFNRSQDPVENNKRGSMKRAKRQKFTYMNWKNNIPLT